MITIQSIKGNPNLIGLWYLSMLGYGRADKVFYAAPHDLKYALEWSETEFIYGAFLDGQLIGCGFINNVQRFTINPLEPKVITRAECGFGFLPNCTIFQALEAGRMILTQAFEELQLDHVFGTTPEPNKEALAYIKRLGLKLYGPIPNFTSYLGDYVGVYTSYISREEWLQRQNKKQS